MSEYIVDFGDKSSAFVGLAMAEAASHGANIKCEVVRCRDCKNYKPRGDAKLTCRFTHPSMPNTVEWCYAEPDGFCAWGVRE